MRLLPRLSRLALVLPVLALGGLSPSLLAGPVPTPPGSAGGEADDTSYDYEALARAFLEARDIEAAGPEDVDLEAILENEFMTARVGLFDLRFPRERVLETSGARDLGDLVQAALGLQKAWLEFTADDSDSTKQALKDLKTLEKWFKSFKTALLVSSVKSGEGEFFAALQIKDGPLEALERLRETMLSGAAIGLDRENGVASRVVLIPSRKDFVEMLALVGYRKPEYREYYWVEGFQNWTEFFVEDTRFLSLEYAEPNLPPGEYERGLDMNQDNPNRMAEQVVQISANALLENYYQGRMPGALISGLSLCLVIEQFGEVDTRVDGDLRSNQTQARSIFIPGGQSEGGRLPKFSAEGDWRSEQGRGHFVRKLRQSQVLGAKKNKKERNKFISFEIKSFDQSERHVVTAPFFGPGAADKPVPPASVSGDFQELLRSYKTGFLHWLRTQSKGKKKSQKAFGVLLEKMGEDDSLERFTEIFEEIYEVPLSDTEASKECLEGQFLKWLSKQKS